LASTYFSEKTFTEGVGFDASNLGYGNVVQSDLLMIPDSSTAFIEEREGQRLLSMICDVYSVDNGKPSPLDPRGILRRNKVGRNELCPCGSGKKYKKCCGIDE